jgi:hypothetical protein
MTVSVLIPFTSDEPWRVRARDHVVAWYRSQGYDLVEGTCPGPWRKAVAVADATRRSTGEILVVADADCLCVGVGQAVAAVEGGAAAVEGGAPWGIPHRLVHRLDEAATAAVYDGATAESTGGRAQRPYQGFAGGGIVVLPRSTYLDVPLDPRFEGFGQEDESWALALTTLCGTAWRGTAPLWHLHHPPAPRLSRGVGSPASRQLLGRYVRAARAGRPAMRALLDETRQEVNVR